jgi:hypothetical protein
MKRKIVVEVPEVIFKKMQKKKDLDGFADRDWGEYLTFMFKHVRLELTEGEMISQSTKDNLFDLWMNNFAENLPHIRKGKTLDKLVPENADKPPLGACIVIGAGPSIYKHKHLEKLGKSNFKGTVIATDSMLTKCLDKGIIPDLTVTVDGAEIISKFYEHKLVKEYGSKLKIMLITTANPKVRDAIMDAGAEIYWFHGIFDDWRSPESFTKLLRIVTKTRDKPNGVASVSCLGNAGATCWVVAHSLLRRSPIALLGIDMGYPEGYPLEKTYYFSTYLRAAGGDASKALAFGYREVYNPFWKVKCVQDAIFRHYTGAWVEAAKHTEPWVITVNCTGGGGLFTYDKTINCMNFEDFLKYCDDIVELKKHFLKAEGEPQ